MTALLEVLDLEEGDVPDFTTLNKSFDRFEMWVWRALLRASAQQHPQSGRVALDSTFFDRGHVSAYYRTRSDRSVETLKVTTLTDTESLAVLDVQCYAQWRRDTRLVRRSSAGTRTICTLSPPITGSKTGTPNTRLLHWISTTSFTTVVRH